MCDALHESYRPQAGRSMAARFPAPSALRDRTASLAGRQSAAAKEPRGRLVRGHAGPRPSGRTSSQHQRSIKMSHTRPKSTHTQALRGSASRSLSRSASRSPRSLTRSMRCSLLRSPGSWTRSRGARCAARGLVAPLAKLLAVDGSLVAALAGGKRCSIARSLRRSPASQPGRHKRRAEKDPRRRLRVRVWAL